MGKGQAARALALGVLALAEAAAEGVRPPGKSAEGPGHSPAEPPAAARRADGPSLSLRVVAVPANIPLQPREKPRVPAKQPSPS